MTTAGLTPSKTLFIHEDSWGALSSYLIHSFINSCHTYLPEQQSWPVHTARYRGHSEQSKKRPHLHAWRWYSAGDALTVSLLFLLQCIPIADEPVLEACMRLWAQLVSEHWGFLAFQARRPFTLFTLLDFQIVSGHIAHRGLEPSLQELHWNELIVARSLGWTLEKHPINKYQVIWGLSWWFPSILSHLCGVKGKLGKCVGHDWHEPETFSGKGEGFQSRVSSDSWNRKDYAKIKKAKVNTKPANKEWAQRGEILLWKRAFLPRRKTRTC